MSADILSIRRLSITRESDGNRLVDDVSFALKPGEVCALVGESGSGKTLISRAVIGLLPGGLACSADAIELEGRDLASLSARDWRAVRGAEIGMVFQEPMASLNPAMRIGAQMIEAYRLHSKATRAEAEQLACDMLARFKVPDPQGCLKRHPHEFSGGMRQRILLAAVMMLRPRLLLADEPTTALDAIVQKDVLDDMVAVAGDLGTSVLLVTHDLGVVARYADQIVVINRGVIEEQGPARTVLTMPGADYTRRLLGSTPATRIAVGRERDAEPLVSVAGLHVDYAVGRSLLGKPRKLRIVEDVTFEIRRGEIVGLVGESGSGKTSTGRAILQLVRPASGSVFYSGQDLCDLSEAELRPLRRKLQLVFQDPYGSLNPRQSVATIVGAGLRELDPAARRTRVLGLLDEVGLGGDYADRFPHQLSGGQRQRVSIARALAVKPEFLVADEPVSALDVTVQSQILDLFLKLRDQYGFGCLFISHDLAVVRAICDRVAVMSGGRIVEHGAVRDVLDRPEHPYTQRLVDAFPALGLRAEENGFPINA